MSCNCGRQNGLSDFNDPKTWAALGIALSPVFALMFLNAWIARRS